MAISESIRSSRVSPMPTRMPVVNGTASSPAKRMVSSRAAGTLSGEPKCGPPRSHNRLDALSSIRPWLTDTLRSAAMSCSSMTPAFTCGRSPVSADTSAQM
ncbi:hypothetical protein D3C85_418800 [compost metagenome]